MTKTLNILLLEDEPSDAELAERELRKAGIVFVSRRVLTRDAFITALADFQPDLILADYRLPAFDGLEALKIAREQLPDIPFIFLSGAMGEEFAIETLHQGAADYVLKGHLSKLVPAVKRALQNADEHRGRKEAAEALQESAERFRNMMESAQDGIVIIDDAGLITDWNSAAERMFGYQREETLGKNLHQLLAPARFFDIYQKNWSRFRETGRGAVIGTTTEAAGLHRDGGEFPIELSISAASIKGKWHAIGIIRDISERKRGELALQRSNRFMKTLSRCNETLVHASDEQQLLRDMCRLIVEVGEFPLAWVGYVDPSQTLSIAPMAWFGDYADEFINAHATSWANEDRLECPMYRAINTGEIQVANNLAVHDGCAPCRIQAQECGYLSGIALPLKAQNGAVVGALAIYAREKDAFGSDEYHILTELAADLSFGISTLRERTAREESARRLEQSLENTIAALATTIETRDPYTAGHQKRVSQLAVAIARALNLAEERIIGVQRGAEVHDIGKIYIPAEILCRPGTLKKEELDLIKLHPQMGYDIVRDIEFPWPVAAMILQHHERPNGQGYPQGLRGDQIMLESRIIAVADVVEAMISHRPYRPALALEAAIAEIKQHRGEFYDAAVVDACLDLFFRQNFTFEEKSRK